jgi:quercetin dioxygenase-like cupin family protein
MKTGLTESTEIVVLNGIHATLRAGAPSSPFTLVEMCINAGGGAPPHRSLDEDKTFVLLEGKLSFALEGQQLALAAGQQVDVKRGDAHGFTNESDQVAKLMLISSPARHDDFFRAMAALPLPHDPQEVYRVCEQFRQVLLLPAP